MICQYHGAGNTEWKGIKAKKENMVIQSGRKGSRWIFELITELNKLDCMKLQNNLVGPLAFSLSRLILASEVEHFPSKRVQ
mmetsp:Transcript_15571/g.32757  ORF Transcript_15571/g.32757 Transcript_15571/m.32757 type:complete len:81 (-) Transcript_15571:226-468(-)